MYAERTGESEDAPLVRFGARLYSTLEVEAAPSRVTMLDLESGALDAAAPAGFALRHRTFLPAEGAAALRVTWPEDGGSGAVVVRYRDAGLPPDVLFLSHGEVRTVPLGGVAIVNRPLRKREAVMGAWINLDLGIGADNVFDIYPDRSPFGPRPGTP